MAFKCLNSCYLYNKKKRIPTIIAVKTAKVLWTRSSSNDDSGAKHVLEIEASLPLTQSALAVPQNNNRHC